MLEVQCERLENLRYRAGPPAENEMALTLVPKRWVPAHDLWRNNSEALPTSPLVLSCFLPVTRRLYGHSSPQHRSTIASIAAPPARSSRKNRLIGRSRNMEFAIDTMRRKNGLKYRAIRWEGRFGRPLEMPIFSPDIRAILPPPKILAIFEYGG